MKKILVPVSFDRYAEISVDTAVQLAKRVKGAITLCHVISFPSMSEAQVEYGSKSTWEYVVNDMEEEAHKKLQSLASHYTAFGRISIAVRTGSVTHELLQIQKEENFDLMVIGSKKELSLGNFIFGSFTERLIHKSIIPVIIVEQSVKINSIKRVVFGNAFNLKPDELINKIKWLKAFMDVEIELVKVNSPTDFISDNVFDAKVTLFEQAGLPANCTFHLASHGHQINGLMYFAHKWNCGMIVIGDKDTSPLKRWIVGEDFAEHVLEFSDLPVLLL